MPIPFPVTFWGGISGGPPIPPDSPITKVTETAFLADVIVPDQISKIVRKFLPGEFILGSELTSLDRRITIFENGLLLDSILPQKINRIVIKNIPREFLLGSEVQAVAIQIIVGETANLLDSLNLLKQSRIVDKSVGELLAAIEGVTQKRTRLFLSVAETAQLLDSFSLTKASRDVEKNILELLASAEDMVQSRSRVFLSLAETSKLLDSMGLSTEVRVLPPTITLHVNDTACVNGVDDAAILIEWDNGTSEAGWTTTIQRRNIDVTTNWTTIASGLPLSTTSLRDDGVVGGASHYEHRVRHEKGSLVTDWDESGSAQPLDVCPGDPNLVATDASACVDGVSDERINLNWVALSGWNVRIERSVNGGAFLHYRTEAFPQDFASNTGGITIGNTYRYRARYERTGDTDNFGATTAPITISNPCVPQFTFCDWNIEFFGPNCPDLGNEQHCVKWTLDASCSGVHLAIRRSTNGGSFIEVRDEISCLLDECDSFGVDPRSAIVTVPRSQDLANSVTDSYEYQVRVEDAGTDTALSSCNTPVHRSTHSTCIQ